LFLYGLLLSLWCFSILLQYYFSGFLQLKGNFLRGQNSSKYRESLNKVRNNLKNGQCALIKKKEKKKLNKFGNV